MGQGARYKGEYPSKSTLYDLYWIQEKTMGEIGEMFGVSRVTIRNWLKKNEIRVKTQSESLKGRPRPWSAANGSKSCRIRMLLIILQRNRK